jgi:hypothetical protein
MLRRQSELTSLAQPFNDGPFEIDEPAGLTIGMHGDQIATLPVREPVEVTLGPKDRSIQPSPRTRRQIRPCRTGRPSLQSLAGVWQDEKQLQVYGRSGLTVLMMQQYCIFELFSVRVR